MEIYIDENEARTMLETVAKKVTNDFKIFIRRRDIEDTLTHKIVEFALVVSVESAADVFDAILVKKFGDFAIENITSGILFDEPQRVMKDMITIKIKVGFTGVENGQQC